MIDGRLDEYADLRAHRRLAALAGRAAAIASLRRLAVEANDPVKTDKLPATMAAMTIVDGRVVRDLLSAR